MKKTTFAILLTGILFQPQSLMADVVDDTAEATLIEQIEYYVKSQALREINPDKLETGDKSALEKGQLPDQVQNAVMQIVIQVIRDKRFGAEDFVRRAKNGGIESAVSSSSPRVKKQIKSATRMLVKHVTTASPAKNLAAEKIKSTKPSAPAPDNADATAAVTN